MGSRLMMFVLILFCLLVDGSRSLNAVDNCKGNEHSGNWTCVKNKDDTLNVTYDCNLNSHKAPIIWIWSPKFPTNMKALSIENCDEVALELNCDAGYPKSFSYLQVVNTSTLILRSKSHEIKHKREVKTYSYWRRQRLGKPTFFYDFENNEDEEDDSDFSDSDDDSTSGKTNLPPNVIFKDVIYISKDVNLDSVRSDGLRLESLKLDNVVIAHMHKHFIGEDSNLRELIMNKVTIIVADPEAITLKNKSATVKITNSVVELYLNKFLTCDVDKLIISGNTFNQLSKLAFSCEANEFVFSDNKIGNLPIASQLMFEGSLKIESPIVNIHGNVFDFVGDNAFCGITAPALTSKSNKTRSRRIFNFTNNEIHVTESKALNLPEKDTERFYDIYNVFNNSINCSCQNIPWFYEIVEDRYRVHQDNLYFTWMNRKNSNKCLNIPNCTLSQAIFNFFELCQDNYQCPPNVTDDSNSHYHFSLVNAEQNWRTLINADKEIADSVKEMLKIAVSDREDKKHLFGNISKIFKGQEPNRLSSTSNERVGDEQVKIISLLTIIACCIIMILILICFIGYNYSKTAGLMNFQFGGRKTRYGLSGTEMESQMSLNP